MSTATITNSDDYPFLGFNLTSVLKFLPLADVLSFSASSLRGLSDVPAELTRRRKRMLHNHRWETGRNERSTSRRSGRSEAVWSTSNFRFYRLKDDSREGGGNVLPSVVDRIRFLIQSKAFVSSHPLYDHVVELHDVLAGIESTNSDWIPNRGVGERDFDQCLVELRSANRAHRLHAQILSNAMRPPVEEKDLLTDSLVIPLDRYLGNVLIAYFFVSHSVCGSVEPNVEPGWMDEVMDSISGRGNDHPITAYSWYKAWIFLHSTVLRTAPFLQEHSRFLGIEPRGMPTQHDDTNGSGTGEDPIRLPRAELVSDELGLPPLIPPPAPFIGADKRIMMSRLSQIRNETPLKITTNTFGGLGPAFRGRDHVRSETIWPMRAISIVTAFFGVSTSVYEGRPSPALLRWREGTEAGIRWLLDLHSEAGKTRPMTVQPPFITITTK